MHRKRFHLNVAGHFYVEDGLCMACAAPEGEAPDLMDHELGSYHCYFKKQPVTSDELERAVMAAAVSCCQAVRYAGTDLDIIRRISNFIPGSCDQH